MAASQLSLFDQSAAVASVHVRRHVPRTSRAARERSAAFAPSHAERVVEALERASEPQTAHELEADTALANNQILRRLDDLLKAGKVAKCPDRRCRKCGHAEGTWRALP